ncbi:MAG: patatin-like phospholipase family protein [Solirubrobacteraceae bacterium]
MAEGTHPVAAVLRERRLSGSRPGARRDPHRVALVLEGGGMRGVVSAGMTAALERLELTPCFDLVVGASAGAINGAAFLAGAAQRGAAAYWGPLASRSFVSPMKVVRRKPVIDVKQILDLAAGLDAAGHERVIASGAELHCVAVDVETARTDTLSGMRSQDELWRALLASSRMPWAGGEPVEVRGRRYLDGGMASPIPVQEALDAGATHVLALQTRPFGVPRRSAIRVADWFIERHLGRLNPDLVAMYRRRVADYEVLVDDLGRRSARGDGPPPHVLGIRPAAGTPCVGQLERRSAVLAEAAADAERLVETALSTGSWLRAAPAA